jgi:lysylphosphatidylglycerol synthetase-like protein (DUF2156 family)
MSKVISKRMRVLLGLVGFFLAVPSVDSMRWFLPTRPLAILCTVTVCVIVVFCLGLLSLGFGFLSTRRKVVSVLAALLLILTLGLATYFHSICMVLAAEHGRVLVTMGQAKDIVIEMLVSGEDKSSKIRDLWDGRFHTKKLADNTFVIWSDGPDRNNDNAERQIIHKLIVFEKTFKPVFPEPYESWKEFLRRMALWEVTCVGGQFDGDIIFGTTEDSSIFIK